VAGSSGIILVVSGPGGAGKSTLCEKLVAKVPGTVLSISATTRGPRPGEVEGKHYFFMARPEFESAAAAGRFAEWAEVAGELYGTPREPLEEALAAGTDVLMDIDVQGGASVRRMYGASAAFVFVLPPTRAALEARMRGRGGDSPEKIRRRLELAEREIVRAGDYDYLVINDRMDEALAELDGIRRAEGARLSREGGKAAWTLKNWS